MRQADFIALERNSDGDIIRLADVFHRLTDAQIERLTGDDQSRVEDLFFEVDALIAEAMA